jgi:hypothetical protein
VGKDLMHYDKMMEDALRGVVRKALESAARQGLRGDHHFYITFRTDAAGVTMPDHLRAKHPQEMTVVLQHQFWGLDVRPETFAVTLSFNGQQERLSVPFAAISAFVDPSVQFGLQFPGAIVDGATSEAGAPAVGAPAAPADKPLDAPAKAGDARVVALDSFRKK